ncbi:ATP-binding protein [Pseudogemmobacter bohemicus]|uniref:ATP-binding protein n=1 Tax=Pseudogemmobacter bohemicus TaxID=2250708 RepID=UPI000DD41A1A|nr:ATP-binding protein [Pseudogemmobacter bohemicus]
MTPILALAEGLTLAALAAPETPDLFAPLGAALAQDEGHPLAQLGSGFALSQPSVAALAVLAAASLSERVARAAVSAEAMAGGQPGPGLPFWLLMRLIPGLTPTALAADAPLMRFDMVETLSPAAPRIEARLRISPALLDRFLGGEAPDARVGARVVAPEMPVEMRAGIRAGTQEGASASASLLAGLQARGPFGLPPAIAAPGRTPGALATLIAATGLQPWVIAASDLPQDPPERAGFADLLSREAALSRAALIVTGTLTPGFADRFLGQIVLDTIPATPPLRGLHLLPPPKDDPALARSAWEEALGPALVARLGRGIGRIAAQFRLDPAGIATAIAGAAPALDNALADATAEPETALWRAAARAVPDPGIPGARLIEPGYIRDDLILPAATASALDRIGAHVRHASLVFDDWGFAARMGGREGWRGRGVAALFSGPPGTGKTMAAEVLAASLGLRVLAVDLSQIMSKWIGETSKNIAALFDCAEASGAVLVCNEGEALWGSRGAVSSGTDRVVNAEISDLLQRMEEFSGFTIVTTNLRSAIDPAFLRRFRFAVEFPAPGIEERLRLWSRAFPAPTPCEEIDWSVLAALPLSGGSIRNVALGAAFRAAAGGQVVTRALIAEEVAAELRKMNLPVPRIDWGKAA